MWFRFPKGHGAISIEQQEFKAEVTDADGYSYFRAPNHFAPRILALGNFAVLDPPEQDPDDDQGQQEKNDAITQLSQELDAAHVEIANVRADLISAGAELRATATARDSALQQVADLTHQLTTMQADLIEANEAVETLTAQLAAHAPPPPDAEDEGEHEHEA